VTNSDWVLLIFCIVQLIVTAAGLYFKQYLIKKGDIRATNENFDELKTQVKETTSLTKSIEAQLDNTAWLNQKRWEIKKEFYLEALTKLNTLNSYFSHILTNMVKLDLGAKDLETISGLENEIDNGIDVIKPVAAELESLVLLQGTLFLGDNTLKSINSFLHARDGKSKLGLDHYKIYEGVSINYSEKYSFLRAQIGACGVARDELIKEARQDLNIVWDK